MCNQSFFPTNCAPHKRNTKNFFNFSFRVFVCLKQTKKNQRQNIFFYQKLVFFCPKRNGKNEIKNYIFPFPNYRNNGLEMSSSPSNHQKLPQKTFKMHLRVVFTFIVDNVHFDLATLSSSTVQS